MSDTNTNTPKPAPNKTPAVVNAPQKPTASTPKPAPNTTPTSIRASGSSGGKKK